MISGLGAASAAPGVLKLPASTKSSPAPPADLSAKSSEPFDGFNSTALTASPAPSFITPEMMVVMQSIAAKDQSKAGSATPAPTRKSDALNDLFAQLDADGNSQISQSEFETALGATGTGAAEAGKVFGKMDKDADGSVSSDEMCAALLRGSHGGQHYFPVSLRDRSSGPEDANVPASYPHPVSSSSVANSDGTTTTSLIYADGSKATMRSAAASSGEAASSYNFIEQMILRQAKAISSATTGSLSVSA
jgi:hypothetical protein